MKKSNIDLSAKYRKQDNRQKFQLGGLVKKAGIHELEANILLGAFIDIQEKLHGARSEYYKKMFAEKGHIAFSDNQ